MTLKTKIFWASITTIALLLLAFAFFYASGNLCRNDQVTEEVSSDRQLKVVVFRRDCGATTGYSTQISVLRADPTLPNSSGNVLIVAGEQAVTARWSDRRQVDISALGVAKVFKRETEAGNVKISYE